MVKAGLPAFFLERFHAINSIWSIVGYTVLLCFTLFKTGSVARSILGAH